VTTRSRSPRARRTAIALGLLGAGLAAVSASCGGGGDGADQAAEADRAKKLVDSTQVHFHIALRWILKNDDAGRVLDDLVRAGEDPAAAERLARAGFEGRREGARLLREGLDLDLAPALPALRARTGERDESALAIRERALLLLAHLVLTGQDEEEEPPVPILLYEASRLSAEELPPITRPLAHAFRSWIFSVAALCETAREEASQAVDDPDSAAIGQAVSRLSERGAASPEEVVADLGRVRRLLADSARSCCLIREGKHREAARAFAPRLEDAQAVGVDAARLALLRVWIALAKGDDAGANRSIEALREMELQPVDRSRYKMLRDTMSGSGPKRADDALARLVDRRWLSRLTLEGAVRALDRDGLIAALESRDASRQALTFARGERAALAAARTIYPFFDQLHEKDGNLLARFRRWLWGGQGEAQ
jgi:hypothetical protein